MRRERSALPAADLRAASHAVCRHVAELAPFRRAPTVALYAAVQGEIDPALLAQLVRARGGRTVYPRVAATTPPTLTFHAVREPTELVPGVLGIPTPPPGAPEVALDTVALVIVPGVAFDRAGHRLGQGRGYYDAALASTRNALRVGVCHTFQVVDAIPRRDADEPVDLLVTPDGAFPTGARPTSTPLAQKISEDDS